MAAVTDGVELVQRLKASGTGEPKLDTCRKALAAAAAIGKRPTSAEIIAALEADPTVPPMTVEKAKSIAETGEWTPRTAKGASAIEDAFPIDVDAFEGMAPLPVAPVVIMSPPTEESEAAAAKFAQDHKAPEAAPDSLGPPAEVPHETVAPTKIPTPSTNGTPAGGKRGK